VQCKPNPDESAAGTHFCSIKRASAKLFPHSYEESLRARFHPPFFHYLLGDGELVIIIRPA
jgi:hypothetical protein